MTKERVEVGSGTAVLGPRSLFQSDDLVADRYRIVRFLAAGGGGEVYEAEDTALGIRVALKTLRAGDRDLDDPEPAVRRFKREIHLARQVTHPNVCRIYDLGQHKRERETILFLTMELLGGENLRDRIARAGPIPADEALPIARRIADALEAARAAGVVHRDLKSANVMLVPSEHEDSGFRTVVTDFGLARWESDSEAGNTRMGMVVGTPEYMAPEQLEGGKATAQTDIYAFGVVLYEMVTGRLPFEGSSPLVTALQRLREEPSSPRVFVPKLHPNWERTILRCLERDPAKRFQVADDVVRSLRGLETRDDAAPPSWRKPSWILAAVGLVSTLALALWLVVGGAPTPVAEASFMPRRSVAVVGVHSLSAQPEHAWLGPALNEMLATEAAAGGSLRVVPGADVTRARLELGLEDGGELGDPVLGNGGLGGDVARRLGEVLGSDLLVAGTYTVAGSGDIRLDLRVEDSASGEVLSRFSSRGTQDGILDLVEHAGAELRRNLGVDLGAGRADSALRASFSEDREVQRLYTEGLDALRHDETGEALELLKGASQLAPDNPLIQSALASAWASAGYQPKAAASAQKALDILEHAAAAEAAGHDGLMLPERERLAVQGQAWTILGQDRAARDVWSKLASRFPDDLEIGLRLASAEVGDDDPQAALDTIGRLRSLPTGDDPRLDMAEAEAARALSDYERQIAAAERALATAEDLGATLLAARASEVLAGAARDLGQPDRGLAAYDSAIEAYRAAGLLGPVARVQVAQAKILRHRGQFDAARALLAEALEVVDTIGDAGTRKHALNTLAIIHRQQGRLSASLALHRLELEANRDTGDQRGVQIATTSLGVTQLGMGRLAEAEANFRKALTMAREASSRRGEEINLNMLGELLLRRGRPAEAREHFEAALKVNEATSSPRGRAYYLSSLGDVDRVGGDLESARARHTEALDIRVSIGEATNVAYSHLSLAEIELAAGDLDAAEEHARAALEEFVTESKDDAEAVSRAILARLLSRRGDHDGARAEIERARALLEGSESQRYLMDLDLASARIEIAAGDDDAARGHLRSVIEDAQETGFVDSRIEAELELALLDRRAGVDGAAARWDSLEAEARRVGLSGLIPQV